SIPPPVSTTPSMRSWLALVVLAAVALSFTQAQVTFTRSWAPMGKRQVTFSRGWAPMGKRQVTFSRGWAPNAMGKRTMEAVGTGEASQKEMPDGGDCGDVRLCILFYLNEHLNNLSGTNCDLNTLTADTTSTQN
ncbi:unnamed protein product, partial [Meganyctiphanes norvegica]